MKVQEMMGRNVKVVSPEDTIQHAARLMEQLNCGSLPVGENDRLVGIVTDRDIAIRAVACGKIPGQCPVRDIMSRDVKYVFEDETAEDAARNMSKLQLRRLPVLSREKRLVGIVALADLARRQDAPATDALRGISARGSAARA